MKQVILSLSISLLLIISAIAGPNDATWNPPARYDIPYTGRLIERAMPQKQVYAACRALYLQYLGNPNLAKHTIRGCAYRKSKSFCVIYYVNHVYKKATPQAVRRHELGHCNGWNGDHNN